MYYFDNIDKVGDFDFNKLYFKKIVQRIIQKYFRTFQTKNLSVQNHCVLASIK